MRTSERSLKPMNVVFLRVATGSCHEIMSHSLWGSITPRVWVNYFWNWNQLFNVQKPSLVAQTVKHLPAKQETQVPFRDQEDPLEKEMATHSSILARRIPWMEELAGCSPWGCKELDVTEWLTHTHTSPEPSLLSKCVPYKVGLPWPLPKEFN